MAGKKAFWFKMVPDDWFGSNLSTDLTLAQSMIYWNCIMRLYQKYQRTNVTPNVTPNVTLSITRFAMKALCSEAELIDLSETLAQDGRDYLIIENGVATFTHPKITQELMRRVKQTERTKRFREGDDGNADCNALSNAQDALDALDANKKPKSKTPKPPRGPGVPFEDILELYKKLCPNLKGSSQVPKLTTYRKKQITKHWKDHDSLDTWKTVFTNINNSEHYQSGGRDGYGLDAVIRNDNFDQYTTKTAAPLTDKERFDKRVKELEAMT